MKIAVVGATGLVGSRMLRVLNERGFAQCEIIAAASPKSVGKKIDFAGRELTVVSVEEAVEMKPDYAIFSAGASASRQFAPLFAAAGTTVIDNSSAWRKDADKPLVVPEINIDAVKDSDHRQPQLFDDTDGTGHLETTPAIRNQAYSSVDIPEHHRHRHQGHSPAGS